VPGEEQHGDREDGASNGYRCYDAADADRVEQIRGLLDSGLTTEIISRILPFGRLGSSSGNPTISITAR
jgi:DNA-binding transcriptional MerR regulator